MKKTLALAAFQVLVLLGWAAQQERVLATAPTFRIPLAPVDPFDVLRGRYFVLNPVDADVKTGQPGVHLDSADVQGFLGGASERRFSGPARVGFCPVDGQERLCALASLEGSAPPGPARFWSRAHVDVIREDHVWRGGEQVPEPGWRVRTELGLRRFFLPNRVQLPGRETDTGWELEVCHRPGLTPLPKRLLFRGQPVLAR